jgi:anaerobic dimethyl sulfoxide reductase subunit A
VHSTHENTDWLDEAFPQRVFINRVDAEDRGVGDGDLVRVFNDRGSIVMPCRITPRIMPGVVDIPEGAWWTPDENGTDRRGCVNVLTSERPRFCWWHRKWSAGSGSTRRSTDSVSERRAG